MSIYDILMLAVMFAAILFGLWKGLAWQVASLAAVLVSYFVAVQFRGPVSTFINAEPPWDRFAAMFILFTATSLIIWITFGVIKKRIEQWHLKSFDKQAGALLGALKGAVLCIVITLFSVSLLGENTRKAICASRSGGYIAKALGELTGVVPSELNSVIAPYIDNFNSAMQEHAHQHGEPGDVTFPKIQFGQFLTPGTNHENSNSREVVGSLIGLGSQQPVIDENGQGADVDAGKLLAQPMNINLSELAETVGDLPVDWTKAAEQLSDETNRRR